MSNYMNRRIPIYKDDSDYTTNAPSYYDDLARKQGLMKHLAKRVHDYDDELKQRFIDWDKNLEEFDDEVLSLLQEWIEDEDKLAHIINDTIFSWKADTVYVDDELDKKSDLTYVDDELDKKVDVLTFNDERKNLNHRGVNVKFPFDRSLESAKGDGVTDDTTALQTILDHYDSVFIPDGKYMIDPAIGLTMKDNQVIEFGKNAWLMNLGHDLTNYQMITMNGDNQTLINPRLNGNRNSNSATGGEHGHGISMRGAINPTVMNPRIKNCWGDAIYIGTGSPHWCENVHIENAILDNNRRQGISVTSAKGLRIINPVITRTNGTPPQSGIDIEPNNPESHLSDIRIINPYIEDNAGGGILIALHLMTGSQNIVDIAIENAHCVGNNISFPKCAGNIDGVINIINPLVKKANISVRDYDKTSPEINIIKPVVIDSNVNDYSQEKYSTGIAVMYDTDDDVSNIMGNVNIIEPTIISTGEYPLPQVGIYVNDGMALRNKTIENVNIINPKRIDAVKNLNYRVSKSNILDNNNILTTSPSSGTSLSTNFFSKKLTNLNLDSPKNITLQFSIETTPEITFEMVNEHSLIINPRENEVILPVSDVPGKTIRSNTAGSSITIKKINADTWIATQIVGNWS